MSEAPVLVETVGQVNLVAWGGKVWAVPQALGPLRLDDAAERARPGVVAYESVERAREALPPPAPPPPRLLPSDSVFRGFVCHFLDDEARSAAEDARMALARTREADPAWRAANSATYGWARLGEVVAPCAMWFAPWYFDPKNPEHAVRRERALAALADGTFGASNYYLSRFYWQQWSDKRPPICVLCPNDREWCVDAKSSNGEGWTVTGDPPLLCVNPSIQVPGYHGHLGSHGAPAGVFTPNG